MKTITKFIYFGFASLALACGSIASAQVPVTPADSAAKAAAQGTAAVGAVEEMVQFTSHSRWHLTVNAIDKFGLVITGASFQKSPGSPFIYVLFDGRLGEIFVPYHSDFPRYYDIAGFNWHPLILTPAQFPAPREIIGDGKICKEKRDYLAWMQAASNPNGFEPVRLSRVRIGEEVVYFSVLGAGNYSYIEEWTFRDDGTILVRAGSTGPKLGGSPEGHMHNFTWRLDIDLNGAGGDSAIWTSHNEIFALGQNSSATDDAELIPVEQGLVWNPKKFNTLRVEDSTLKNGSTPPRATSYELVPMRGGTSRHTELFTKKDFWVTRYNPDQFLAKDLPNYVSQRQSTDKQDIVIWYTGSEHHEEHSRDEDKNTVPVLWAGFELVPNNLFDHTPFYPNP